MQDRFKFRVWDNIRKSYIDFSTQDTAQVFLDIDEPCLYMRDLDDEILYLHDFSNDNFIMEQCTGLKDKNGNLIYEGDIVSCDRDFNPDGRTNLIRTVIFSDCAFKLSDGHGDNYFISAFHNLEIIGNIHTTEKE